MGPFNALWHLANFFAPAVGVAVFTTLLVKLLWRHELATVGWGRLLAWGCGAGALVLLGGLVAFGRDGRMATYGALVGAVAVALWWAGFVRR
jgi:hypothetical protein